VVVSSASSDSSSSSDVSHAHPASHSLLIQPTGRWQGGKGKYQRHYEVWPAALVEVGNINGWHIRRCDMAHILVVDPLARDAALVGAERDAGATIANAADAANVGGQGQEGFVLPFPPRQYRMVIPLLMRLGEPVPFAALFAEGVHDPERDAALRKRVVKPLRKKLKALGLQLLYLIGHGNIGYGYMAQIAPVVPVVPVAPEHTAGSQVMSNPATAPEDDKGDAAPSTTRR
jgi:hypothetical protein